MTLQGLDVDLQTLRVEHVTAEYSVTISTVSEASRRNTVLERKERT